MSQTLPMSIQYKAQTFVTFYEMWFNSIAMYRKPLINVKLSKTIVRRKNGDFPDELAISCNVLSALVCDGISTAVKLVEKPQDFENGYFEIKQHKLCIFRSWLEIW